MLLWSIINFVKLAYSAGFSAPEVTGAQYFFGTASELPVAVTMSSIILSEYDSWSQWVGVFLILGGIVSGNIRYEKGKKRKVNSVA